MSGCCQVGQSRTRVQVHVRPAAPDRAVRVSALRPAGPSAPLASQALDPCHGLEGRVRLSKYWRGNQLAFQIQSGLPESAVPLHRQLVLQPSLRGCSWHLACSKYSREGRFLLLFLSEWHKLESGSMFSRLLSRLTFTNLYDS